MASKVKHIRKGILLAIERIKKSGLPDLGADSEEYQAGANAMAEACEEDLVELLHEFPPAESAQVAGKSA